MTDGLALLTDLYQLTMASGYWKSGQADREAVFHLTFRRAPFGGGYAPEYPVRMSFAGPLESYSRLKTFFRIILAIPVLVLRYVMNLLLEVGAVAAWFVVLITGKMPRGLFDLMVLANSYTARSDAYLFLLTETYPPFQDTQTRTAGTPEPSAPEPPSAS